MAEVLTAVKRDLGPHAVILHTRPVRRGGFLGIGARRYWEVTAAADVRVMPRTPSRRRAAQREQGGATAPAAGVNEPGNADGQRGLLNRTYGQIQQARKPQPRAAAAVTTEHQPAADAQLALELKQIRQMVGRVMRGQSGRPPADLPEELSKHYLTLLEQEVADELAEKVMHEVCAALQPDELKDEARVCQAVRQELARLVPVDTAGIEKRLASGSNRPHTIALVGPTGVGKTTTVAKLAATFKLRQKLEVALVTIDTYRIAAVDQLRTYADILQIPVHIVVAPDDMRQAMQRCADVDVVLIDTAGRSQRDREKLDGLRQFLDIAEPDEVHLVLSSTCSQQVIMEAVEQFGNVRTDKVIFTKLDEAVSFGVLLNVAARVNKRLSFVTTGQEVPHQLEPGNSARLAGLIMGEPV